jgi:hypothetical protein
MSSLLPRGGVARELLTAPIRQHVEKLLGEPPTSIRVTSISNGVTKGAVMVAGAKHRFTLTDSTFSLQSQSIDAMFSGGGNAYEHF